MDTELTLVSGQSAKPIICLRLTPSLNLLRLTPTNSMSTRGTLAGKVASKRHHTCMYAYLAGLASATGWSCMVSSPSLVKAAPAAEKISPTW